MRGHGDPLGESITSTKDVEGLPLGHAHTPFLAGRARTRYFSVDMSARTIIRGLCAGALGGALAGALDYALSAAGAARFLPQGTIRLGLFLIVLYAGFGAATGALAGVALRLLGALLPDLRRAAAYLLGDGGANGDSSDEERRALPYVLGALASLALLGVLIRNITLFSLARFHAHLPIAALVGAACAALVVPTLLMTLLFARLLRPVARFGPRLRAPSQLLYGGAPLAWVLLVGAASLGATMASVLLLADAIQLRPRMMPALRAFNTALYAPILVAVALVAAHALGRLGWRVGRRAPLPRSPAGALALVFAVTAGAVAAGLGVTWKVAQHIDWRPFLVAAVAIFIGLEAAALGLGARLDHRSRGVRIALAVVAPLLLLIAARGLGGRDRVRKAAFTAGLAPALMHGRPLGHRPRPRRLLVDAGGGSDCNDLDREVHPGAFDWPDDGIDQNCNGHQATATPTPRPPFAAAAHVGAAATQRRPHHHRRAARRSRRRLRLRSPDHAEPRRARPRERSLFENGWAHAPSTRYSVPAILIGRYASTIAWDPRAALAAAGDARRTA